MPRDTEDFEYAKCGLPVATKQTAVGVAKHIANLKMLSIDIH